VRVAWKCGDGSQDLGQHEVLRYPVTMSLSFPLSNDVRFLCKIWYLPSVIIVFPLAARLNASEISVVKKALCPTRKERLTTKYL
jgi:hypothetical protein